MFEHLRRPWIPFAVGALVLPLAACGVASDREDAAAVEFDVSADVREALASEGPVQVIDPDYLSATIGAELITQLLNAMGGDAETLKMAEDGAQWATLATSDNVVYPEAWAMFAVAQMEKYVDKEKSVVELGEYTITGDEGWHVPTYMIEGDEERGIEPMCPGLPDYKALNDCVDLFKTAATGDKGRFLTGAKLWVEWYGDAPRIKNLGLDYEIVPAGSEAALVADLKRAYDRGEPWLGLMWSPHFATLRYDLTMIEFPPYSAECWATTFACGWDNGPRYKFGSAAIAENQPTVASFVRNFDIAKGDLEEIMIAIEEDGAAADEAVAAWIEENPDVWAKWIPEVERAEG